MQSAHVAWLAELPTGMLPLLLVVGWVLACGCTFEKGRDLCNKLEI